ncbi:hypothetical protein BGW36DRAFT_90280 [Talaromyces proteolyticus]|uniref:Uncharacterized protein n=1 Tax=Talaromyces proteolyticus TaxID=1131652 RepID=A0AAD4KZY2_9EURO|nr:uncharacterized protein BGW36DRAFT_90280 [Talaromyces proteolyticus]KAH8703694.1 hypothetical protein BGW36DRAFT_90280 [Talaromyces proteolyticus]
MPFGRHRICCQLPVPRCHRKLLSESEFSQRCPAGIQALMSSELSGPQRVKGRSSYMALQTRTAHANGSRKSLIPPQEKVAWKATEPERSYARLEFSFSTAQPLLVCYATNSSTPIPNCPHTFTCSGFVDPLCECFAICFI